MVSTIYRMSSAMIDPPTWYYETFVWPLKSDGSRGTYIDETVCSNGEKAAFEHHFQICKKYLEALQ
jgi:hypothetical protein